MTPDVAAALERMKSRGGYRFSRGRDGSLIDFDTDLALVAQALADARRQAVEECMAAEICEPCRQWLRRSLLPTEAPRDA